MNNRSWIAVFLGLACLVLFVSVMGASGNWLNGNNDTNNRVAPQQINQTVRDMNKAPKDGNLPTEIDANNLGNDISNATKDVTNSMTGNNDNNSNNNNNTTEDYKAGGKILMPQMN